MDDIEIATVYWVCSPMNDNRVIDEGVDCCYDCAKAMCIQYRAQYPDWADDITVRSEDVSYLPDENPACFHCNVLLDGCCSPPRP